MVFGHDGFACVTCGGVEVVGIVGVEFGLYGFTDPVGDPWVSGLGSENGTCRDVFV